MLERLLIPTDGSEEALQAAEFAADLAAKYGAEVTMLTVVELPPVVGFAGQQERLELREKLTKNAEKALDATRGPFEKAGIDPQEDVAYGSAVSSIIRYARDADCDLIVMGSRGVGTSVAGHVLLGSTAEGVLHEAPCPVLLVRPKMR